MSKRPVELLVSDIREAIDRIEHYTSRMSVDELEKDQRTIDAVVRNLEIIGEAANRLPDEFKEDRSNIEWQKVIGLRNRIVHAYFGIDLQIVWQIIRSDLPPLRRTLSQI